MNPTPSDNHTPVTEADGIHHVPFTKVGVLRVRFLPARPMKPRTLDLEEEECKAHRAIPPFK